MRLIFILLVALFATLLFSSLSLAEMQTFVDKNFYNLDDQIRINTSIVENKTQSGFLRMQLLCSNLSFQFYLLPLSIEQNKVKQISTELPSSEQMMGQCSIEASFVDFSNNIIDKRSSDEFNVTDKLYGYFRQDKEIYKPEETVIIGGYIKKASGEDFKGKLDTYFDGMLIESIDLDNNFESYLKLNETIKGGKHFVKITINGKNKIEKEFPIFVESEPRKLLVDIKQIAYLPGETVKASISIKDQAGDSIRQDVAIDLVSENNNWLGGWKINSDDVFEYKLDKFVFPGTYTLSATFNSLVANAYFNVSEFRKLDFNIQDNIIVIENLGNVAYNDTVEVYLESKNKRYLISKKVILNPGEITKIELYKEVPDNIYNVTVPLNRESTQSINLTNETIDIIKISHIKVQDERTLVQKSGDKINEITGAFLGGGTLSYLSIFIIGILLSLFIFFNIRRLKNKPSKSERAIKKEIRRKEINSMLKELTKK